MSLRAFFAKQSHHWEIATPQGERLRPMTGTWVLMSDFFRMSVSQIGLIMVPHQEEFAMPTKYRHFDHF
jgi:hypothetical protein